MAFDAPLAGKRIAVTRRISEADESALLLAAAGATPVLIPAIDLVPLEEASIRAAVGALHGFAWIVFVSVAAVDAFVDHAASAGVAFLPRVAAIGPATAQRVRERLDVDAWLPVHFRGSVLGETLPVDTRDAVMILGALDGDPALEAALRKRGASVTHVALYQTETAAPPANLAELLEPGLDAITFASPSAVRGFVEIAGTAAVGDAIVACIGNTTAATARELGMEVQVVSSRHTFVDLVEALSRYFADA